MSTGLNINESDSCSAGLVCKSKQMLTLSKEGRQSWGCEIIGSLGPLCAHPEAMGRHHVFISRAHLSPSMQEGDCAVEHLLHLSCKNLA